MALSFFIDYFIWQGKPFGFHLTNIILHILTAWCVYRWLFMIVPHPAVALFASFLFALHPVQSELVNNIGYRSDLLMTLFYLLAMISFVRERTLPANSRLKLICPYVTFFLALLSKEAAVTLPVMLLVYDVLYLNRHWRETLIQRKWEYTGLFTILGFYFYLYFFAVPNHALLGLSHFKFLFQLKIILKIFYNYVLALLWPFSVHILPPVYVPIVDSFHYYQLILAIIFLCLGMTIIFRQAKKNLWISFSLIWFFVTYLPTSNLIPLPNPYAYRFLYLPSVGFCVLLAALIERAGGFIQKIGNGKSYSLLFKIVILVFLMIKIIPLNRYFKNDVAACQEMIKNYPDSTKPYEVLGIIFLQHRSYDRAINFFPGIIEHVQSLIHNFVGLIIRRCSLIRHCVEGFCLEQFQGFQKQCDEFPIRIEPGD